MNPSVHCVGRWSGVHMRRIMLFFCMMSHSEFTFALLVTCHCYSPSTPTTWTTYLSQHFNNMTNATYKDKQLLFFVDFVSAITQPFQFIHTQHELQSYGGLHTPGF